MTKNCYKYKTQAHVKSVHPSIVAENTGFPCLNYCPNKYYHYHNFW